MGNNIASYRSSLIKSTLFIVKALNIKVTTYTLIQKLHNTDESPVY